MTLARACDIKVRVPAKVMLAGEYAVLAGGRALAVTLDCWLLAHLSWRSHSGISVASNHWREPRHIDEPSLDAQRWQDTPLLHATAINAATYGIDRANFAIASDIQVSDGIGSSSALRLAVSMAMAEASHAWPTSNSQSAAYQPNAATADPALGNKTAGLDGLVQQRDWQPARMALALQRAAQGSASGYDVATQFVGGLVQFTGADSLADWPGSVATLPSPSVHALSQLVQVFVGGKGAATGPLLQSTQAWLLANGVWAEFCQRSDALVKAFDQALAEGKVQSESAYALYRACAAHRQLLSAAPAFPHEIAAALAKIPGIDQEFSWKTTGAGGDDAILLIGAPSHRGQAEAVLRRLGRRPLGVDFTDRGAELTRHDEQACFGQTRHQEPNGERTPAC